MKNKNVCSVSKSNGFGVTGLVLGLVGLVIFPPFFGVLAIIFSSIGLSKDQKYSKAGLVLGIVDLLWMIVALFLFAGFVTSLGL